MDRVTLNHHPHRTLMFFLFLLPCLLLMLHVQSSIAHGLKEDGMKLSRHHKMQDEDDPPVYWVSTIAEEFADPCKADGFIGDIALTEEQYQQEIGRYKQKLQEYKQNKGIRKQPNKQHQEKQLVKKEKQLVKKEKHLAKEQRRRERQEKKELKEEKREERRHLRHPPLKTIQIVQANSAPTSQLVRKRKMRLSKKGELAKLDL